VLLASVLGIELTHVPYKGMSPAINDVAGGHIPFMFTPIPFAQPLAQAGKIRMLGVTTAERIEAIPDVPPLTEIGVKEFDAVSWFMLVAPAGTPGGVIDRLSREVRAITGEPEVRRELSNLGLLPVQSPPPDELKGFIAAEITRWGDIVRKAGLVGSQ
jgi:tripartite-type tricarboxylate transporter receptor subunit TctC